MKRLVAILAGCGVLAPAPALACPVCFGAVDSPVANGMNLAILVLLGITAAVLASFAAFFVHLARRARTVRESETPASLRHRDPDDAGHSSRLPGGTIRLPSGG